MKSEKSKWTGLWLSILLINSLLFGSDPKKSDLSSERGKKSTPLKWDYQTIDAKFDQKTDHLDILTQQFSCSEDSLSGVIEIREGSFPFVGKFKTEYYSYMVIINCPNPQGMIWAMTAIQVPIMGYSPGLYRIKGRKRNDLQKIAEISYHIKGNQLLMKCGLKDLWSDPLFRKSYQKSGSAFLTTMTFKTKILPFNTTAQDSIYPLFKVTLP